MNTSNHAVRTSAICSLVIFFALEVIKMLAGATYTRWKEADNPHDHWASHWGGQVEASQTWTAEISENDRGYGRSRILHLYPQTQDGSKHLAGITGHDNNCDGQWDEIFIGGTPITRDGRESTTGFNSVILLPSGGWKFHPCPWDKDHVQPFTNEQIVFAIHELDQAMKEIRNPAHHTLTYLWDEKSKSCYEVKAKDLQQIAFK